jgi:hypothetical protein
MWWTAGRLSAGLVLAAAVAGCTGAPDVPIGARATESVWCADADGVVDTVTWEGHDGPLSGVDVQVVELDSGAVSEEDLLDACARRFRWPASATLCEAYAAAEGLRRYSESEFVAEQHGEPGADRPGFPVVVSGQVQCEEVELDAGPAAASAEVGHPPVTDRLRSWQSTQRFNDWRGREAAWREAAWREAADEGCLDIDTARENALTAQAELAGDWPVLETARNPEDPSHAGLCFDLSLRREGYIDLNYQDGPQTPAGVE